MGRFFAVSVIFIVGLFLDGCLGEPPVLPDETQEGLGTFGCLVDGELVVKHDVWQWGTRKPYGIRNSAGRFELIADVEYGHEFRFYVSQPQVGIQVIDSAIFRVYEKPYYFAVRNAGQIRFTKFDLSTLIASGTFEFEANCYDRLTHQLFSNRKILVNKGVFDLNINR